MPEIKTSEESLDREIVLTDQGNPVLCQCNGTIRKIRQCQKLATEWPLDRSLALGVHGRAVADFNDMVKTCSNEGLKRIRSLLKQEGKE